MALTNSEKQRRWRDRRNALAKQAAEQPGIAAPDISAEEEKALFMAAVKPLLDGLFDEGKKNMATMSPGTVAALAGKLERVLVGWDFAKFGRRARRCRLCGEKIQHGKIVPMEDGPAHWACHQRENLGWKP